MGIDRFNPNNPHIIVRARLFGPSGVEWVDLILDTGATHTIKLTKPSPFGSATTFRQRQQFPWQPFREQHKHPSSPSARFSPWAKRSATSKF